MEKERLSGKNGSNRGDPKITRRILDYLAVRQFSSITEVAAGAKTTRITATKHLERLVQQGDLEERRMAQFRVFYKNIEKLTKCKPENTVTSDGDSVVEDR